MHAVAARFDLRLLGPASLKEKRQVLKSLTEGVRKRFNVGVAEVDFQDLHQRAAIGVAVVAGEAFQVRKVLQQIERFIGAQASVELIATKLHYLEEG